jgi:hypothetical protein
MLAFTSSNYILRLREQNEDVKKLAEGEEPSWHQYLIDAFRDFVAPLTHELRKLMMSYKILNEGELFCTNLAFNLDDENHGKLIGDPGQKDEDAVKALNMKIKQLMEEYQVKMRQMLETKKYSRMDFAKAIYFTAYYNPEN